MNNLFSPTKFLYDGGNSKQLREELQKFNLADLKEMYDMVSGWKLEAKVRNNKELLIEEVIKKTLHMCNRGWVFHPNTKDLPSAPYK